MFELLRSRHSHFCHQSSRRELDEHTKANRVGNRLFGGTSGGFERASFALAHRLGSRTRHSSLFIRVENRVHGQNAKYSIDRDLELLFHQLCVQETSKRFCSATRLSERNHSPCA